jgi:hypothetical protein
MPAKNSMQRAGRGVFLRIAMMSLSIVCRIGFAKPFTKFALRQMSSPAKRARAFAGYEPSGHDVIVATFAKSGTNWMMQISQQLAHYGEAEFDHIHNVVPWPESPAPGPISLSDPGPQADSPTGLRIIKTHNAVEHVPYQEKATYLTVIRDPKEVAVSSYYFLGGILGVLPYISIDDWFEIFMDEGGLAERWVEHTAGFWDWRDRPNVLLLNYGGILKDPRASLARVAETMGVELTPDQFEKVLHRSSFEYMSAHESQFAPPQLPFTKEKDRARMVRRGKSGASDEALSPAQQARIDDWCQAQLKARGSDFPYADAFDVVT